MVINDQLGGIGNQIRRWMPGAHPKPYESALWQHLDTIRLLRRQRKTWTAIAAHLEKPTQLKALLTVSTVQT